MLNVEYFIRGLSNNLAVLVKSHQPANLEKAIKYARQYEHEQLYRAKSSKESKNKGKLLMATKAPRLDISVPTNSFLAVVDKWKKAASEIMSQLRKLNRKSRLSKVKIRDRLFQIGYIQYNCPNQKRRKNFDDLAEVKNQKYFGAFRRSGNE